MRADKLDCNRVKDQLMASQTSSQILIDLLLCKKLLLGIQLSQSSSKIKKPNLCLYEKRIPVH